MHVCYVYESLVIRIARCSFNSAFLIVFSFISSPVSYLLPNFIIAVLCIFS